MNKESFLKAFKLAKENSSKRNFKQTVDLIVNLKDIDLKKQDNKVDVYAQVHFPRGKPVRICALVAPELMEQARKSCDMAISVDDFGKYDKKASKKLANDFNFFIAQATVMTKVAASFGRIFGPKSKMPNPKAGCVVPPNANLPPVVEKLRKTVRIKVDAHPLYQAYVGVEDMDEAQLADNATTIYNALVHALPQDKNNIKEVLVKLTMGKPVKVE